MMGAYCKYGSATTAGIGVQTIVCLTGSNVFGLAHWNLTRMLSCETLHIMVVSSLAADFPCIPYDATPRVLKFMQKQRS